MMGNQLISNMLISFGAAFGLLLLWPSYKFVILLKKDSTGKVFRPIYVQVGLITFISFFLIGAGMIIGANQVSRNFDFQIFLAICCCPIIASIISLIAIRIGIWQNSLQKSAKTQRD